MAKLDDKVVNRQVNLPNGQRILVIGAPQDRKQVEKLARQLKRGKRIPK